MRVTLDTNILISASFWSGASEKIIAKAEEKEIILVLSKEIIKEFLEVLEYQEIKEKIKGQNLALKRTVEKIVSISEIVDPKKRFFLVEDDPDDNKILECAVEGKADYIITKDKHLLNLSFPIPIIEPESFLRKLSKQPHKKY